MSAPPVPGRAGLFEDDLSDFRPKPPVPAEQLRGIAEQSGFRSREPAAPPPGREPRRYRTGRNQQLNLKVRAEDAAAFYALADAQGWVLGETFGRAVAALERELAGKAE